MLILRCAVLAALAVAAGSEAFAQAKPLPGPIPANAISLDISTEYAEHGVHAIGHTDPAFFKQLAALIGAENATASEAAHPFMVLVRNDARENIARVCMRLPRISPDGRQIEGYINFAPVRFVPGRTMVFTPDPGLTASLHRVIAPGTPTGLSSELRAASAAMVASVDSYRFQSAMVSLDSVWFESKKVVGPDRAGNIQEETGRLAALKAVRDLLLDLSVADADVRARLEEAKAASGYDRAAGRFDRGVTAARGVASSTLMMWDMRNRADAAVWLGNLIAQTEQEVARIHR
ncbi:MAG: hypothetical protein IPM24_08365 [Bryobacterales bacterium]|nr:hypothetical protein [Bryobacterales bacterium]